MNDRVESTVVFCFTVINAWFLSTWLFETKARSLESRTKSPKIEKMFYRRHQIRPARNQK